MNATILAKARLIRLLILDVDGVLTDGGLQFNNRGDETKTFNSLDGQGMRMLLENEIEIAIITGRKSDIVSKRMNDLGIRHVFQGNHQKLPIYEKLISELALEPTQVAYVGDDLPDLPIMRRVGLSIAVSNAHEFVRQHSDLVTHTSGGKGAVREVSDLILQAQSRLDTLQEAYLE
ncbi:MAG: 3-deoxy-manno-octulosonate-8-phosphatase KdsC [Pseudomonadota bacterium]